MTTTDISTDQKIEKEWYVSGLFSFDTKCKDRDQIYSIDTPPPTISGILHMGHVFSYCHTDFVARFWRMMGKNVFYPIGFDNNGLPTERLVEKVHGISAIQMARSDKKAEFLNLYENVVKTAEAEFEILFKRLGLSFDWSLKYDTNSQKSNDMAKMSFADLFYKNLVYLTCKPVYWDTTDQTALAQADIEDKEVNGTAYNIKFTVHSGTAKDNHAPSSDSILETAEIMTTRPELLPACVCLFYNPEDKRYNGSAVGQFFDIEMVDGTTSQIVGTSFANKFAKTPLGLSVDIIPDDNVDIKKGTGLVMCCTFGDWQDVEWAKKLNISTNSRNIISNNGRILNQHYQEMDNISMEVQTLNKTEFDKHNSKTVIEARQYCHSILESKSFMLKDVQVPYLTMVKNISHTVKCAERSGKPVEILNKPQWYVDFGLRSEKEGNLFLRNIKHASNNEPDQFLDQMKSYSHKTRNGLNYFQDSMLKIVDKIKFYPAKMKKRLQQWIEGLNQDWCISRNRFAGISIPRIELYTTRSRTHLFTFLEEDSHYEPYNVLNANSNRTGEEVLVLRDEITKESKKANLSFSDYVNLSLSGKLADGEWLRLLAEKYKNTFDLQLFFELDQDLESFVFDTWFTSSISPQLNTGFLPGHEDVVNAFNVNKKFLDLHNSLYPFDLRPQAHEIIRTWAFYTIAKSNLHTLQWNQNSKMWESREDVDRIVPWNNIALSGWCLARDKTKMSKSKGNAVDPIPLLNKYNADCVRYWSSTGNLGTDTPFNEEALRQCSKLVKKIESVASFFATNKNDLLFSTIKEDVDSKKIDQVFDKWILSRLSSTIDQYIQHFQNYEHNKARECAEKFFWTDLCDNYIEIIKGRIYGIESFAYKSKFGSNIELLSVIQMQNSAITTLHYVVLNTIKLFAPFIPFATEKIYWKHFAQNQQDSIHKRGSFIAKKDLFYDELCVQKAEIGLSLISDVRKYKADHKLSLKSEIVTIETKEQILKDIEFDVRCVCNALNAKLTQSVEGNRIEHRSTPS